MKRLFRSGFALMAGLFLALPALAQDGSFYPGERVDRVSGWHLTFSATNEAMDPGFTANWVRVCVQSLQGQVLYLREGKTLAEAATADAGLVTSANFIAGAAGSIEGRAWALGHMVDGQNAGQVCETIPWETDGLVAHTPNTSTVSADVVFYGTSFPDGRW